jgi:hypothetical protein
MASPRGPQANFCSVFLDRRRSLASWPMSPGSAKPIACDASAASALDASEASGTMDRRVRRLRTTRQQAGAWIISGSM